MTIRMESWERLTLDEMEAFVENNQNVRFKAKVQDEAYGIIEAMLKNRCMALEQRAERILGRYLAKKTGLSRAQVTRLQRWKGHKRLRIERAPRRRFAKRGHRASGRGRQRA